MIDESLEELVFLLEADEGNYGLYSLIWELSYHREIGVCQDS